MKTWRGTATKTNYT